MSPWDKACPTCGIFGPNSLDVAHHIAFIRTKSTIRRNEQLTERIFALCRPGDGEFSGCNGGCFYASCHGCVIKKNT
ncbi:DUF6783 domain-containing protein [Enterocloster bolteae]|uniref:DUF6783 domain-containing protein n=1 Tax=Enterocloster bolteae TaxID=208479 RepID=UPI000CF4037B|nr:DUF6783 domain-containing protein [Enterocloster bolteae]PQL51833.1 hypothetical protein C5Z06_16740 [Enterocloster bolteae]